DSQFSEALQTTQIVDQSKQHDSDHQADTELYPPTLHPIRQGTTTRPLDQIKQQMPPIPVLDGGHLLFYLIEWARGRPLSDRVQGWGIQIGISLVVGVMLLALVNDLGRL
ncbi:site-2 protease family protein, partial [Pseudomonas protegens]|uniref:site-2 protease family protein n=1 Tax=Pseudomonas protegens TaxID=380021 RepID=UPI0031F55DA2